MSTGTVTFSSDALARQIDQIAKQSLDPDAAERLADIAHMLLGELLVWQQRHSDAWVLIGRIDMYLELIGEAEAGKMNAIKKTARTMRDEIKKASGL